jgi:DNA-binding MarR family transcriptional regulator
MTSVTAPPPAHDGPAAAAEPARLTAIRVLLDGLADTAVEPEERYFDAAGQTLVDAVLAQDHAALTGIADYLRSFQSHWCDAARESVIRAEALGRLRSLLAVAFLAAERMPSERVMARVAPKSRAHRLLDALDDVTTLHTRELVAATGLDRTAISHISRELEREGLIVRTRVGKSRYYEITSLGREALRIARGARPRPVSRVRARAEAARGDERELFVECTSWAPLVVDAAELARARREATRGQARSRVLLLDFLMHSHGDLARRLLSWDEIAKFVGDEHIQFALPPLHASTAVWRRSTVDVIERLHGSEIDLSGFLPAAIPAFDAFALIRGADGRQGVVLVEAKSEVGEFRLGRVAVRTNEQGRQLDRALKATSRSLGARRGWKAWTTSFPDPAARLAVLHHLRERDVPAWLLNVYFVTPDPHGPSTRSPSALDWLKHISEVCEDLAISDDHGLSTWIKNEFVELPEPVVPWPAHGASTKR